MEKNPIISVEFDYPSVGIETVRYCEELITKWLRKDKYFIDSRGGQKRINFIDQKGFEFLAGAIANFKPKENFGFLDEGPTLRRLVKRQG